MTIRTAAWITGATWLALMAAFAYDHHKMDACRIAAWAAGADALLFNHREGCRVRVRGAWQSRP